MTPIPVNFTRIAIVILSFSRFFQISQSSTHCHTTLGPSASSDLLFVEEVLHQWKMKVRPSPRGDDSRPVNFPDCRLDLRGGRNFLTTCSGGATSDDEESDNDISGDGDLDDDDASNDEFDLPSEEDEDSDGFDDIDDKSEKNESTDEAESDDEESDEDDSRTFKQPGNRNTKRKATIFETGVGSLTSAAAAAFKLTKGGVKVAVDLVSAKHVTSSQIVGKWRMEQEVEISKGASITCPASLEFTEDGRVVTSFEGKTLTSDYKFTERPWPRKCSIQFEAAAFQGPGDKEPVSMFYKGYFKKSIMNPNVVLIRGRVYRLMGNLFWKKQKKCGTFKATQKRYR